jgi:hypothetical protein
MTLITFADKKGPRIKGKTTVLLDNKINITAKSSCVFFFNFESKFKALFLIGKGKWYDKMLMKCSELEYFIHSSMALQPFVRP